MSLGLLSLFDRMASFDALVDEQLTIERSDGFQEKVDASCAALKSRAALLEQRRAEEKALLDQDLQLGAVQLQSKFDLSEGRLRQALNQATDTLRACEERAVIRREQLQREIERVNAEEMCGIQALKAQAEELANTDYPSFHMLMAEREKSLNAKIQDLEFNFEKISQNSHSLHNKLLQLEQHFTFLKATQDRIDSELCQTQAELRRLSQDIAETQRIWEEHEAHRTQLFTMLLVASAALIIGGAAISACQASQGMAVGMSAGDVVGSSISIGLHLTEGEVALGATAGGMVTSVAFLTKDSEDSKKKKSKGDKKPLEERTLIQNHGLASDILEGVGVHKIHHKYGKPSALSIETLIESLKQEFHSQENPIRDHLISGSVHVGMTEALGFMIKSRIPAYWLVLATHTVGDVADLFLADVHHFLDTQSPEKHASAVPKELKGECPDLYQVAIVTKLALQAARWPSHALHAIHHKLTEYAAKAFNAAGITDHNIAAFFEYIGKHVAEEDALS